LMRIYPKVSTGQVDPDTGLPSEETTEVETDVLLSSGQGIVIGGLIQEVDNNIQSKIPLLGDIPYLGVLFSRRTVTRSRQEIIVTLQPHVLPYEPVVQAHLDHQFLRTAQPLTHGAIASFPRPYEPRLPDQFDHLHKHKKALLPDHWVEDPNASTHLMVLPPVEGRMEMESWEAWPIEIENEGNRAYPETLPAPEASQSRLPDRLSR